MTGYVPSFLKCDITAAQLDTKSSLYIVLVTAVGRNKDGCLKTEMKVKPQLVQS